MVFVMWVSIFWCRKCGYQQLFLQMYLTIQPPAAKLMKFKLIIQKSGDYGEKHKQRWMDAIRFF